MSANRQWCWHFMFPQQRRWRDRRTGEGRRHPIDGSLVQRAISEAVRKAGLTKRVSCQTLKHSFATELLAHEYDIRAVQERLGHQDVLATVIYTHLLNRGGRGLRSPPDGLVRDPDERQAQTA